MLRDRPANGRPDGVADAVAQPGVKQVAAELGAPAGVLVVGAAPAAAPATPSELAPAAARRRAARADLGVMLDRLEVKYLVDRTRRTALERDVMALMRLDAHSRREGGYWVRSLYLDTPDYLAYHEKLAGAALRHKLRLRVYGADPARETPFVRLEIKSRVYNFIHKTTADVPLDDYPDIERALRCRTLPPARLMRDPGVRAFFRLQRQLNMEPKVIVQYRRQAFERPEFQRVRVSFDDEVFASRYLDLLGPLQGGRRVLPYGHAVFEMKADGVMTRALHMLIGKYDLAHEAVSKYCYAVRATARLSARARARDL